jgi:hypothetical protein
MYIAASASPWLAPMMQRLTAIDAVSLWAPWAHHGVAAHVPQLVPRYVPTRIAGFLARRQLPKTLERDSRVITDARWQAVQAVLRLWALNSRARDLRAGLYERRMLAAWTCDRLQRASEASARTKNPTVDAADTIVAASLAAREPFALAKARGMRTMLFLDLPHLATLHADLDRAAQRWPADHYLQHFRAPGWAIARQHAEFELADHIIVRGPYAARSIATQTRRRLATIEILSAPATGPLIEHSTAPGAPLLLAGPAAGRSGFAIAAEAAAQCGRSLLVRSSAATEPQYRATSNVQWLASNAPQPRAVAAIVAPAVCEAYVQFQHGAGLNVIGSDKVAGVTHVAELTANSLANALGLALG